VPLAAAAVGFPCLVKAVSLSASQGVLRADDPAAAVTAASRIRHIMAAAARPDTEPLLVEEYLPGPELSIDALLTTGGGLCQAANGPALTAAQGCQPAGTYGRPPPRPIVAEWKPPLASPGTRRAVLGIAGHVIGDLSVRIVPLVASRRWLQSSRLRSRGWSDAGRRSSWR
jgi:formate-dependent phosphoribosylglycinamide formyltransferase (GAR transformylase)